MFFCPLRHSCFPKCHGVWVGWGGGRGVGIELGEGGESISLMCP